jgi:predicted protein tyrosine phosphatase
MKFITVSRQEIERGVVVRGPYIVISISDPRRRRPRIRKSAGFRDALFLKFHDAVPDNTELLPSPAIVLMTEKQAKRIWKFVLSHQHDVDTVVVQCEQGMSRSPAIAAALCKTLGANSSCFFREYQPNEHVFRLVCSCRPDCRTQLRPAPTDRHHMG